MAYNTGNSLGSTDPRDLSDNSENFDQAVNDTANATWTDRFGNTRVTLANQLGYNFKGDYAAGIELVSYSDIIRYNGEFYRPSASATLPYTTTATLPDADSNLAPVGDAVLRQDLASPATSDGSDLVAHTSTTDTVTQALDKRTIYVGSVAELEALSLPVGANVKTLGYYTPGDGGGNDYEIVSGATGTADGGLFINLDNGLQAKGLFPGGAVVDKQFGIVGDGVADDTTAWVNALALGKKIAMTGGSRYLISSLAIPSGSVITGRDAEFVSDGSLAATDLVININSDCIIDRVFIDLGASNPVQRAVQTADNCVIGHLEVVSTDQLSNSDDTLDAAIQIRGDNLKLGYVSAKNIDKVSTVYFASGSIETLRGESFVRVCYLRDSNNLTINKFIGDRASPNASISAGHNALLIDSVDSVGSTNNIRILNIDVNGSGEHGIRIGGDLAVNDVYFGPSIIRNTGSCGIKIRGGGTTSDTLHKNITIDTYNIYDCGSGLNTNQSGILLQRCQHVTVAPGKIHAVDKAFSAHTGLRIDGAYNVSVSQPEISGCETNALHFDDNLGDDLNDIEVCGGRLEGNAGSGILFSIQGITLRRVKVTGKPTCEGNGAGITKVGTGTLTDCYLEAFLVDNTATTNWSTSPGVLANLSGDYDGSAVMSNASTYQQYNGSFYLRKGGAWTAL